MNKPQRYLLMGSCIIFAVIFHFAFKQVQNAQEVLPIIFTIFVPLSFLIAAAYLFLGKPKYSQQLEDHLFQLKHDDRGVRAASIRALAEIEGPPQVVIPALVSALKDDNEEVRVQAARTLATYGPKAKSAVNALIEALHDRAGVVRGRAARALGKIGQDAHKAVDALNACLKDEDELVRLYAMEALTRIGITRDSH